MQNEKFCQHFCQFVNSSIRKSANPGIRQFRHLLVVVTPKVCTTQLLMT